jgi:hypothetical protein
VRALRGVPARSHSDAGRHASSLRGTGGPRRAGLRSGYALGLTHEQASVGWSHYQLRKSALERQVALRPAARALLARVERVAPRALGLLGGRLYQLQHTHAVVVSTTEWRRIWAAYHARRSPMRA